MGDFLQNFQRSMDGLAALNDRIRSGLQTKSEFSANLLTKLRQINEQIRGLANKISALKQRLDALQLQVDTNTGSIGDKEALVQRLTQQVSELEAQRNILQTQLDELKQKTMADIAGFQSRIDDCESRFRAITDENKVLTERVRALEAELAGRGDIQAQHAQELKAQADAFAAQAQETMRQNDEEKAKLREEILYNSQQLEGCERELSKAEEKIAQNDANIDASQAQLRGQIDVLNGQVAALTTQNADLKSRIEAATVAINQASGNLEQLINAFPNAQSNEDFRGIFDEITQSIQDIDHLIEGNGIPINPGPVPPVPVPVPPRSKTRNNSVLPPDTMITVQTIEGTPLQIRFSTLVVDLGNKRGVQKYIQTLAEVRAATTPEEVSRILQKDGIKYKNGKMMGGRKTKKLRKQKGGFLYKTNTKRRSLSSNSKRRSRSSFRKSNKSSF